MKLVKMLCRLTFGTVTVRMPSDDIPDVTVSALTSPGKQKRRKKLLLDTESSRLISKLPSIVSSFSSTTLTLTSPSLKSCTSTTI